MPRLRKGPKIIGYVIVMVIQVALMPAELRPKVLALIGFSTVAALSVRYFIRTR